MKKILSLLLLLALIPGACDKEESRVETWTVAPEKGVAGIAMGFGHVPAYIIQKEAQAPWEIFPNTIEGFSFEKGYQTVMRVRIDPIANPPADGPGHRYTMEEQLSRTRVEMSVDPASFSPEYEVLVASERNATDAYWIKDLRESNPQWVVFPWEIREFDFVPGNEYRLRIQPVAEYDSEKSSLSDQDSWTVKYRLREVISVEEKDSEGLPE